MPSPQDWRLVWPAETSVVWLDELLHQAQVLGDFPGAEWRVGVRVSYEGCGSGELAPG